MDKNLDKPLSEAEKGKLSDTLDRLNHENAMNLEMVDGFFVALHCAPEMVAPSDFLSEIWGGGEMGDDDAFDSEDQFQSFFSLLMRHYNDVVRQLENEEVYLPLLLEDEQGEAKGNDWATGFVRGTRFSNEHWVGLFDDEDHGGMIVPIFALANENNPDPDLRSFEEPVTPEKRETLLVHLAAATTRIYRYFQPHRKFYARQVKESKTFRREQPKVGRNDPCPCGSGKKYKKCCGHITLH